MFMKSIWMLAAAEPTAEQTEVITAQPQGENKPETVISDKNGSPNPPDGSESPRPNPWVQLLPLFILLIVMYLLLFRGPRRKQQEHQKMVSSLKKNDRVRTVGGIYGTVVEVRPDEIILKVDESANTKIRVIPSAIATVISDEKKSLQ